MVSNRAFKNRGGIGSSGVDDYFMCVTLAARNWKRDQIKPIKYTRT